MIHCHYQSFTKSQVCFSLQAEMTERDSRLCRWNTIPRAHNSSVEHQMKTRMSGNINLYERFYRTFNMAGSHLHNIWIIFSHERAFGVAMFVKHSSLLDKSNCFWFTRKLRCCNFEIREISVSLFNLTKKQTSCPRYFRCVQRRKFAKLVFANLHLTIYRRSTLICLEIVDLSRLASVSVSRKSDPLKI